MINENEIVLCIPGPWKDRTEFLQQVVVHTDGKFMFAGGILANPTTNDHVALEFCPPDRDMQHSFQIAGQGRIPTQILEQISSHQSVVYLSFPINILEQRSRIIKFTSIIEELGGYAIKVESTGIAHTWDVWQELLNSDNPFDQYRGFVVLISDEKHFYSCGMHHFNLPDCQISQHLPLDEAADTMNRFNYFQIVEKPVLEHGHTFSLSSDSPYYRLSFIKDFRHAEDSLFRNSFGLWDLEDV